MLDSKENGVRFLDFFINKRLESAQAHRDVTCKAKWLTEQILEIVLQLTIVLDDFSLFFIILNDFS